MSIWSDEVREWRHLRNAEWLRGLEQRDLAPFEELIRSSFDVEDALIEAIDYRHGAARSAAPRLSESGRPCAYSSSSSTVTGAAAPRSSHTASETDGK